MLHKIQIVIQDANNILIIVSPMVQHAFRSLLVKQVNNQLLAKVIQAAHRLRYVWTDLPVQITIVNHSAR